MNREPASWPPGAQSQAPYINFFYKKSSLNQLDFFIKKKLPRSIGLKKKKLLSKEKELEVLPDPLMQSNEPAQLLQNINQEKKII